MYDAIEEINKFDDYKLISSIRVMYAWKSKHSQVSTKIVFYSADRMIIGKNYIGSIETDESIDLDSFRKLPKRITVIVDLCAVSIREYNQY